MLSRVTLFIFICIIPVSGTLIAQPEEPVVTYLELPQDYQFYPRDPDDSNRRKVLIEGRLHTAGYDTAVVIARRNGVFWKRSRERLRYGSDGTAFFDIERKIKADTIDYSFEVLFRAASGELVSDTLIDNVACGDVYIIQGQSNAVAENEGGFTPYQNHWVRSFGTASEDSVDVVSDTTWGLAQAQFEESTGYVGIWGLRLGKLIAENHRMPVCILNGAVGGTKIEEHLRNDSLPTDLSTIYGRMLWRAKKGKLDIGIRGILWWQGEANSSSTSRANEYLQEFPILRDQWKTDYEDGEGNPVHFIYTTQIHPGYGSRADLLREYQRKLAEDDEDTFITVGHDLGGFVDGNHFSPGGYDRFADRIFRQISRTIYRNFDDDDDIDPPNIQDIIFTSGLRDELRLEFADVKDLYWQNDSLIDGITRYLKDHFYFYDGNSLVTTAKVDTGYVNGHFLTLKLDTTVTATSVSYLPPRYYTNDETLYEGPWLKTRKGVPALSFYKFPISIGMGVPDVSDIQDQTIGLGNSFAPINLDDFVEDVDNLDSELTWTTTGNVELLVSIDANRVATISPPNANWSGRETITFSATDPQNQFDSDQAVFTINAPPVISDIQNQTIAEGGSFASIALDDFVSDANHDDAEISWSFNGHDNLEVEIDENRIAFIGPLDPDWNGTEVITFTAADPLGASDIEAASFQVTGVNDPPQVTGIEDQTVPEGQEFATIALDNFVDDPDNADSEMTWQASGNSDLNISISESRVATIAVPNSAWNGSESITFTATDPGGLSDDASASFTVTPVNNAPAVSDIGDQTVSEGQAFAVINLDDFVDDSDNPDNEISWTVSGNMELTVIIDQNRNATITPPTEFWFGSEVLTFTATDPSNLSDSDAAVFTITGSNDAPVLSDIPDQTIAEDSSFAQIHLDDFVEDVDDPDQNLNWLILNNRDLIVTVAENRVVTIEVPDPEWNDDETITFVVTDPSGLAASNSAKFTVTGINDQPTVSQIGGQTVEEAGSFLPIALDDFVEDADNADFQMSWSISGNEDLTFTMDGVRNLTIHIPSEEWNGTEVLTFTASDPGGLSGSTTAAFTVTAVNDTPSISNIPNQQIDEGGNFSAIQLDNFIDDIDAGDEEMEWIITGNTWLQVTVDSNRVVTIAPPDPEWSGTETITFAAIDPGGLEVSDTAAFTVRPVNDPPVINGPLPALSFNEDDSLMIYLADYYQFVEDPELPDSLLSLFISGGNNIIISEIPDGLRFTASENWHGSETFLFSVSDGEFGNSAEFSVSVHAVNDPPAIMNFPDSVFIEGEESVIFNLNEHAEDMDTPDSLLTWTFQKSGNLLLLEHDEEARTLTLTGRNFASTITVTCTVTDDAGESKSATIIAKTSDVLTGISGTQSGAIPDDYVIYQNYPNPFNPVTHIKFGLPVSGKVKLEIYNVLGQKVITLWNGFKPAGYHALEFYGRSIPSGIYLYRIQAAEFSEVRKMMLIQ